MRLKFDRCVAKDPEKHSIKFELIWMSGSSESCKWPIQNTIAYVQRHYSPVKISFDLKLIATKVNSTDFVS